MDPNSLFCLLTILSIKVGYLHGAGKAPNFKCWPLEPTNVTLKNSLTSQQSSTTPRTPIFDPKKTCQTNGKEAKECCIFPFMYKGVTYDKCTRAKANSNMTGWDIRGKLGWVQWAWCATIVNNTNQEMKKWHHCGPKCPGYEDLSANNWKNYVTIAVAALLIIGLVVFIVRCQKKKNG